MLWAWPYWVGGTGRHSWGTMGEAPILAIVCVCGGGARASCSLGMNKAWGQPPPTLWGHSLGQWSCSPSRHQGAPSLSSLQRTQLPQARSRPGCAARTQWFKHTSHPKHSEGRRGAGCPREEQGADPHHQPRWDPGDRG